MVIWHLLMDFKTTVDEEKGEAHWNEELAS